MRPKDVQKETDRHFRMRQGQLLRSMQQHPWLLTFRDAGGVLGSISA